MVMEHEVLFHNPLLYPWGQLKYSHSLYFLFFYCRIFSILAAGPIPSKVWYKTFKQVLKFILFIF